MPELTKRFEIDDVALAWDQWGHGVPLVLCHGFSGSASDFDGHVLALAEERRVVAFDQRGHGRSTKVGRLDAYSLERLANDLTT